MTNSTEIFLVQDYVNGLLIYGFKDKNVHKAIYLDAETKKLKISPISDLRLVSRKKEVATNSQLTSDLARHLANEFDIEKITASSLYIDIKLFLETYIVFPNDESSSMITIWIMTTYCFMSFEFFPYIHINGEKRSGKTMLMELISRLAFNGLILSDPTPATIFRDIEANKTTLLIDEFESLGNSQKDTRIALLQILNTGFKKDGKTMRCTGDNHTPTPFSTYSPKIFGGINHIADTLEDRTIMYLSKRKKGAIQIKRLRHTQAIISQMNTLVSRLYQFGLKYASTINQIYETEIDDPNIVPSVLNDRSKDIWEPLFSTASVIDAELSYPQVVESLKKFAIEEAEFKSKTEVSFCMAEVLLRSIIEFMSHKQHCCRVTDIAIYLPTDIFLNDLLGKPDFMEMVSGDISISKLSREMGRHFGFFASPKNLPGRDKLQRCYVIAKSELAKFCSEYGVPTPENL